MADIILLYQNLKFKKTFEGTKTHEDSFTAHDDQLQAMVEMYLQILNLLNL